MPKQVSYIEDSGKSVSFYMPDNLYNSLSELKAKTRDAIIQKLGKELSKRNDTQFLISEIEKTSSAANQYRIKFRGYPSGSETSFEIRPALTLSGKITIAECKQIPNSFDTDTIRKKNQESLKEARTQLWEFCWKLHEKMSTENIRFYQVHQQSASPTTILDQRKDKEFGPQNREAFLHNVAKGKDNVTFDSFYDALMKNVIELTPEDISSIGLGNETQKAKEFCQCIQSLNEASFYNVNGKPINFWSGLETGQKAANNAPGSLSDSDVPAINIVMQLGNILKNTKGNIEIELANKLFSATSRVYASQAIGIVQLFFGGFRQSEQPAIMIGNFHWNRELDILRHLHSQNKVDHLELYLYNYSTKKCDGPYSDLDSPIQTNQLSFADATLVIAKALHKKKSKQTTTLPAIDDKDHGVGVIIPYDSSLSEVNDKKNITPTFRFDTDFKKMFVNRSNSWPQETLRDTPEFAHMVDPNPEFFNYDSKEARPQVLTFEKLVNFVNRWHASTLASKLVKSREKEIADHSHEHSLITAPKTTPLSKKTPEEAVALLVELCNLTISAAQKNIRAQSNTIPILPTTIMKELRRILEDKKCHHTERIKNASEYLEKIKSPNSRATLELESIRTLLKTVSDANYHKVQKILKKTQSMTEMAPTAGKPKPKPS